MPGPFAPWSKYTSASYIEIEPQGHRKPNETKEVSAQYIAGPVISQVDARGTDEHNKQRGDN